MYLQEIRLKNFRCFKDEVVKFRKGLNVLVGENDSGKTAIIDAIRIVLGSTDQKWNRLELTDIYEEQESAKINIILKFVDLTKTERGAFLECLSYEKQGEQYEPCLYIYWDCGYSTKFKPVRLISHTATGLDGNGPDLSPEARGFLKVTYLRPLRDAYSDLRAGKNSRLSQIIQGIPDIDEGNTEYIEGVDPKELSISGIAELSNHLLAKHPKLKNVNERMNEIMSKQMLLNGDNVTSAFEVAGAGSSNEKRLIALLEKLDVVAKNMGGAGKVGLGTSNILSMACEFLLNRNTESTFLLTEEPEAHIHAQRQLRLIQSLQSEAEQSGVNHQIIVTTHSPIMASMVSLEDISIVKNAKVFSLAKDNTNLKPDDYQFLELYLDATKANLFFAKAVMIVEGPSEELLIPTIAKILGMDFSEYGVSIVNVRGKGLRRFARIFQRADESKPLDVKVACLVDRDIMPNCAPEICLDSGYKGANSWPKKTDRRWRAECEYDEEGKEKYLKELKSRADGQNVKTFISDHWTFEYDLAHAGLAKELIEAISQCLYLEGNKRDQAARRISLEYDQRSTKESKASYLYSYLNGKKNKVSKAQIAQQLAYILESKYLGKPEQEQLRDKIPTYIKEAINYVTTGRF